MPNPHSAEHQDQYRTPNDQLVREITRDQLPLRCPLPDMSLWNSHPAVYLPIEDSSDGRYICPYCSTEFVLKDE
ncbi:MAG: zinc-finger domain-containing protein [Pseudomonadota bacterium]|nr:zinc-finger domain-containing protein [Pseudomonadota bacterium]